jgi:hypothetical protein
MRSANKETRVNLFFFSLRRGKRGFASMERTQGFLITLRRAMESCLKQASEVTSGPFNFDKNCVALRY